MLELATLWYSCSIWLFRISSLVFSFFHDKVDWLYYRQYRALKSWMQLQRCLVPMVRCRLTAILPQKSGSVQCCCLRPLENCDKGAVKSNNKSPKKSFHGWMCLERSSNTSRSPVLYTLQWGAQIICKVKYKISHDDCNPFLHPIYSSSNKIWHYYSNLLLDRRR